MFLWHRTMLFIPPFTEVWGHGDRLQSLSPRTYVAIEISFGYQIQET